MPKEFGKLQHVFNDEDEWKRYQEVIRRAKQRAIDTDRLNEVKNDKPIIRRLLGLEAPDWIVSKDDLRFFQGRATSTSATRVRRGDAQGGPASGKDKKVSNGNNK